jgi:hypothetical protein
MATLRSNARHRQALPDSAQATRAANAAGVNDAAAAVILATGD